MGVLLMDMPLAACVLKPPRIGYCAQRRDEKSRCIASIVSRRRDSSLPAEKPVRRAT